MKLLFEKIRIKNMFSFGADPTEIVLNSHRLTLVSGANGTGKTTAFFDAICYALYGKTFRVVIKDNIPNYLNRDAQEVTLWFTANGAKYRIERKPTEFSLYKNEERVALGSTKTDSQVLFQSLLQVDFATFKQMVLMPPEFTSFMKMKTDDRRKIVEDILDLGVFSDMNAQLLAKVKENIQIIAKVGHELGMVTDRIRLLDEVYNSIKTDTDREKDLKQEEIDNWNNEIDLQKATMRKVIAERDALAKSLSRENIDRATKLANNTTNLMTRVRTNIEVKTEETDFLVKHTVCPTCTQDIDEQFRQTKISENQAYITERKNGLVELTIKFNGYKADLDTFDLTQKQIDEHDRHLRKIENEIKLLTGNVNRGEAAIVNMKKKKKVTDRSEYENYVRVKKDLEIKLADEEDTQRSYNFLKVILKDTGIKAQIIKSYIPKLNEFIHEYLVKTMGANIDYWLDENFEGYNRLPKREGMEFNSFSDGEKARISLAIMFAWRKIARQRGAVDCNLLIMDELFDGSLDDAGVAAVMKILLDVNEDENYVVISPYEREFEDTPTRALLFTKPNGFTEIEEKMPATS